MNRKTLAAGSIAAVAALALSGCSGSPGAGAVSYTHLTLPTILRV